MYVCMYVCIYIYIDMYICIYICIYTCIYIYMYVYVYVCIYIIYVYIYVCIYMYVCIYIYVCVCTCICYIYVYVYVYVCVCVCMCIYVMYMLYVYVYVYVYVYIYTYVLKLMRDKVGAKLPRCPESLQVFQKPSRCHRHWFSELLELERDWFQTLGGDSNFRSVCLCFRVCSDCCKLRGVVLTSEQDRAGWGGGNTIDVWSYGFAMPCGNGLLGRALLFVAGP